MPLATDVQLPPEQAVSWPPCCVACLAGEPECCLRVARHRSTLLSFLMPLLYLVKRPTAHEVPICGSCRRRELRLRWLRLGILVGLATGVFGFCYPWVQQLTSDRFLRKLVLLGAVLVVGAPLFFWEAVAPPAVDITVGKERVTFEFRNREYALLFLASNGGRLG